MIGLLMYYQMNVCLFVILLRYVNDFFNLEIDQKSHDHS